MINEGNFMLEDPRVERFLDPNCSDEELDELRAWLEYNICPKCSSKNISIEFESVLDQEQYLIEETVDCCCCNERCGYSDFISRNLD